MLKAKDIMTKEIYTVAEDLDLKDLATLFVKHNVNAMPVVDKVGNLVGMVSQTDLVEQDRPLHIPTVVSLFDWVLYLESPKKFAEEVAKVSARKVGEICNRDIITCGLETPVSDIANLMVENKAHLIPVLDCGQLVGVVARLDIVRTMGL